MWDNECTKLGGITRRKVHTTRLSIIPPKMSLVFINAENASREGPSATCNVKAAISSRMVSTINANTRKVSCWNLAARVQNERT